MTLVMLELDCRCSIHTVGLPSYNLYGVLSFLQHGGVLAFVEMMYSASSTSVAITVTTAIDMLEATQSFRLGAVAVRQNKPNI